MKLKTEFSVEDIGKFGLYNCRNVKSISAKNIGICALAYGKKLEHVYGVDNLLDGALFSCEYLEELEFNTIDIIGRFALAKTGLKSIKFAGSYIGDFALYQLPKLSWVKIDYKTRVGKSVLLDSVSVRTMTISGEYKLTSYFGGKMPKVTKLYVHGNVSDDFCRNNPYLQELQILHAEKFGGWSFYNNSALKAVTFTDVKTIGCWAFAYCDCIETITLPKTVEFIGMNAFRYCHNLSQITINSSNCVLFGANAFYSTAEEKVFYVKKGLKKEYLKASIWTEYRDLINEMV